MTTASNNPFPSVLVVEGSAPASPAAGDQRLFIDSADHKLKRKDSSGTVTTVEGGSATLTHSYVGYNTAGGSTLTMTQYRVYMKSVSLSAGQTILSIDAYLKCQASDHVGALAVAVFSDNAGSPLRLLKFTPIRFPGGVTGLNGISDVLLESAVNTPFARWVGMPINYYNDSGATQAVWIAVMDSSNFPNVIAYDGSGTDAYYTSGGAWWADAGFYTVTVGTNKYSIRADVV